jgi:hypothetical protein
VRQYDFSDEPHPDPQRVHLTRLDVPFLDLTWFFVKSSLALALAFTLTSWLWVLVGTGVLSLVAGLLWLLGVPALLAPVADDPVPAAIVAPAHPGSAPATAPAASPLGAVEAAAVEPAAEAVPSAPGQASDPAVAIPASEPLPPDPDRAATEALQRAELERRRQERAQGR